MQKGFCLQEVVELHDHKWRALNVMVAQRLKKLMVGVADPESSRLRQKEKQR